MTTINNPEDFFNEYSNPENFIIDQWCAQSIYQVMSYAGQVYVYSPNLSQENLEKIGIIKITDVQETIDLLLKSHSEVIAAPEGPYVVGINES